MTIREAISGEIEPYGLSDESIEKAFIDSNGRFGDNNTLTIENDYSYAQKKVVAFAAMLCLNRLRELTSENIGGISQSYDVKMLESRIKAIAAEIGISPDLVLADDNSAEIYYVPVW